MRALVTYFSKSGNTKKIAEHIYAILKSKNYQVDILSYNKINDISTSGHDLYFIGSPCYSNDIVKPIKSIINKLILVNKIKIFGFVTHSTEVDGEYYQKWAYNCEKYYRELSNSGKINLIGYYHCQAKPNFLIKLFIKRKVIADKKVWEEYIKDIMNHPNQDDFKKLEVMVEEHLLNSNSYNLYRYFFV